MRTPATLHPWFRAALEGLRVLAFTVLASVLVYPVRLVGQHDLGGVRGRVVTGAGAPVVGAQVELTALPVRTFSTAATDSAGRYSFAPAAPGVSAFVIRAYAAGYLSRPLHVDLPRRDTLLPDIILKPAESVRLPGVVARGTRPVPRIARNTELERTATEQWAGRVPAASSALDRGDLAALAGSLPGVVRTEDGISVFGLPSGQNNVTLNGLAFAPIDLPRDLRSSIRVTRSTYDPARGGFAGAQTAVVVGPASGFDMRRSHLTLDAPPAYGQSATAAGPDARQAALRGELGFEGHLSERVTYSLAGAFSRRAAPAFTVDEVLSESARSRGVDPDSVARFLTVLENAGLHYEPRRTFSPFSRTGSFVARADYLPFNPGTRSLLAFGQFDGASAPLRPLSAPSGVPAGRRGATAGIQLSHTTLLRKRFLNDLQLGVTYAAARQGSVGGLPSGTVGVSSATGDVTSRTDFGFGGIESARVRSADWTGEFVNETRWFPGSSAHQLKAYVDSRYNRFSRNQESNPFGSYTYESLSSLAANRPSSYERTLGSPTFAAGAWTGSAALGDTWNPSPRVQLLIGARLDASWLPVGLEALPRVEDAFRLRSDYVPSQLGVSPRFGFSWGYGSRKSDDAQGASGPRGIIRGGIGEFRSTALDPALLGVFMRDRSAVRVIRCLGPAIPAPDWRAYTVRAADEPECAAEGAGIVDRAPNVRLVDPGYRPPRAWRASLSWSSRVAGVNTSVEGNFSLDLNQPGWLDLNHAAAPGFLLAGEGGRAVMTRPDHIDPGSGRTLALGARKDPSFGPVMSYTSDLRSVGDQVSVRLVPTLSGGSSPLTLTYVLSHSRAQFRGFDGGAFGDPAEVEWAPSSYDARHQFVIAYGARVGRLGHVSVFGNFTSGRPYTPLVDGDPNGDGRRGDRAFGFDPDRVADPGFGASLRELARTAPAGARECLREQIGRPIARNSCRGPWSGSLNVQLTTTRDFGRSDRRWNVDVQLLNLLGAADRVVNGRGELRGWGSSGAVDPVVYRTTGFDPRTRAFAYEVNRDFGRRPGSFGGQPFSLVIDFSLDWGKTVEHQVLEHAVRPRSGKETESRATIQEVEQKLGYIGRDFFPMVLGMGYELMLDAEQEATLREEHARYTAEIARIRHDLAAYLVALPQNYSAREALARQRQADRASIEVAHTYAAALQGILTPFQLGLLPNSVKSLMRPITDD